MAREFWIAEQRAFVKISNAWVYSELNAGEKPYKVIEKQAYTDLQARAEKLFEALEHYASRMDDGGTARRAIKEYRGEK